MFCDHVILWLVEVIHCQAVISNVRVGLCHCLLPGVDIRCLKVAYELKMVVKEDEELKALKFMRSVDNLETLDEARIMMWQT